MAAPLYNCFICYYYLCVVRHNRKGAETYIAKKIEPFLHAIPIAFSLIGAITIIAMDSFHPNMTYCYIGTNPTCDGLDCVRKRGDVARVLFGIFSAGPYIVLPCVIVGTMTAIYRTVLTQEKTRNQYGGVAALKSNIKARKKNSSTCMTTEEDTAESSKSLQNILANLKSWRESRKTSKADSSNSKRRAVTKNSQHILHKAMAYSIAFLLTYMFPIIISIRTLAEVESGYGKELMVKNFKMSQFT